MPQVTTTAEEVREWSEMLSSIISKILLLDDIRKVMFDHSLYKKIKVEDLMHEPMGTISLHESMDKVMSKFRKTGAWNLTVTCHGEYIGFISKSKLFSKYRQKLVEFSEE